MFPWECIFGSIQIRRKREGTKIFDEQLPVGITLHMTEELVKQLFFEGFAKSCVNDFVDRINGLQDFLRKL